MENKDEKKEEFPFPEGLEYIEELVNEARQKVDVIDRQLDKTPREFEKPQAYGPRYNPPGFLKATKPVNPVNVVYGLENQKTEIETGINKRVDREIEAIGLDPETAIQLREATFHKMNPNPFEGKSEEAMKSIIKSEKDINYSQEYMRQLKTNFKEKEKIEKIEPTPSPNPVKSEVSKKEFSMSARFSQTLSYTKASEPGISQSGKGKGKDDLIK